MKERTSARTGSAIYISNIIDSGAFGSEEPRGAVQLQRCFVAIVLYVLTTVKRVRDQFLEHFSGKLSVLDAEREVTFAVGSDVYLGR